MGTLDLKAPNGKGGEWLVDPADIYIVGLLSASPTNYQLSAGTFSAANTTLDSTITDSLINAQLLSGTSITVSSTRNIYVQSNVAIQPILFIGSSSLTFSALAGTLNIASGASFAGNSSGTFNLVFQAQTITGAASIGGLNGGTVTFDVRTAGVDSVYSGLITPSVVVQGGGTLHITGNNTSSGTTLVTGNSKLVIGDVSARTSGNLSTGTVTINAGSTLQYMRNDSVTMSQTIAGAGNLVVGDGTSTGSLILTGSNTYSGLTTINTLATLQIGNATATGTPGTGSIVDNGKLLINRTGTLTISSIISGSGSGIIDQGGTGVTVLSGNNTFSGTLSVSAGKATLTGTNNSITAASISSGGTLEIGSGGTTGSIATVPITDNGTLIYNRTDSTTLSQAITGATGNLTVSAGTLILTGANTYGGITTISNTSTLQIGSGGSTGAVGTGAIVDNGALIYNQTGSTTISQAITNTTGNNGNLTVSAGTLTLTGTNTLSGNVTVNGGTLVIAGDTSKASSMTIGSSGTLQIGTSTNFANIGTTAITDNGTLNYFNSDAAGTSTTWSQNITGTGILVVGNGSYRSSLNLTGTNTLTGDITVNFAGGLQFGVGTATGYSDSTGNLVINGGGVGFNTTGSITVNRLISGTNVLGLGGTGTVIFARNNTFSGDVSVYSGKLVLAGTNNFNSLSIASPGTVQVGNGTNGSIGSSLAYLLDGGLLDFNLATGGSTTVNTVISDVGKLQVTQGTVILTGANTYSGSTTILSGATLQIGSGGATGVIGTGAIVDNGTLVFNRTGSTTISKVISGATGNLTVSTGTLILTGANTYGGTTTISSPATLQIGNAGATGAPGTGPIVNDGKLLINRTGSLTLSNTVSGASTGNIEQFGTGTTLLSGNNSSYLGSVTVTAGTLQMGSASTLSASNALTVNGGTFSLNGFNETVGDFSGTGGTVSLGANTLTAGGASSLSYAGIITGTGGFTKAGTGTLTLTGANTYSGATTINASSILQIGSNDITGSLNPSSQVIDNGTLIFNRKDAFAFANTISGTGALQQNNTAGTGITTLSGNNSAYSGTVTVTAGTLKMGSASALSVANTLVLNSGTFDLGGIDTVVGLLSGAGGTASLGSNTLTVGAKNIGGAFGGSLSGTGNFIKDGTAFTSFLGNNSSFSGTVTVQKGTLVANSTNAFTSSIKLVINSGTFNLLSSVTVGNFSGSGGTVTLGSSGTLTVGDANPGTFAGIITGAGSFTNAGTGLLTLSGNNTFTGTLTVSAGQVTVTGTNNGIAGASISAGATLQVGDGTANGTLGAGAITD